MNKNHHVGTVEDDEFHSQKRVVSENPLDPQSKPSHPFSDFRLPLDVFAAAGLRLLQVKHFYNSHTGTKQKTKLCKWLFGILIGLMRVGAKVDKSLIFIQFSA